MRSPARPAWKVLVGVLLAATPASAGDPKYEYRLPDPAVPPPTGPATVWKGTAQLGFTWLAGNSESIGVTGSALLAVKRWNNQFELFGQGAYARGGVADFSGGPVVSHKDTARSWLGRLRYDRYFLERNTVFVSYQMSGDEIAGYVYRIEPQAGYARIFFQSPHQTVRGEIGYDYTFERYNAGTTPADKDFHSGRLFLFYENKFTPYASFSEGLELLEAFNRLEHFRLNSLTSLSSTIAKNVSLKLNFTLKYNNDPPQRPAPPAGYVCPANVDCLSFGKLDTVLEAVVAVTFL